MNIEELQRALPRASALAQRLGLAEGAVPQPDGITIRCPFHADSTPSCSVRDYENGIGMKCFGCLKTGTAFDLIAFAYGLDPDTEFGKVLEVARTLATDAPLPAPTVENTPTIDDGEFDILARALLDCCPLELNESVITYMKTRGLFVRAVSDGWGALPDTAAEIQNVTRELGFPASRVLGLETTDGLRFPGHRLVIPWRSADGTILTLQRRTLDPMVKERKYVFPAKRGAKLPYGAERLRDGKPVSLVEGAMDVLAMRELCEREQLDRDVLGLPGVQNWNPAWNAYVQGRTVLISVDNDDAGNAACLKLAKAMRAAGAIEVVRRVPRTGKDWANLLETEVTR